MVDPLMHHSSGFEEKYACVDEISACVDDILIAYMFLVTSMN